MSDMRSPIAKARDAYLESPQGEAACAPETIGAPPANRQYLSNRIEAAFVAGWMAAHTQKVDTEATKADVVARLAARCIEMIERSGGIGCTAQGVRRVAEQMQLMVDVAEVGAND